MLSPRSIICALLLTCFFVSEATRTKEMQTVDSKFLIQFDEQQYLDKNIIVIQGLFSTYVNCGSQYATWFQFPGAISYTLTDLDSEKSYKSIDFKLSISWDGNHIYARYAKQPCNAVVEKKYMAELTNILFRDVPEATINNYKLSATYLSQTSNELLIRNTPIVLKGFN